MSSMKKEIIKQIADEQLKDSEFLSKEQEQDTKIGFRIGLAYAIDVMFKGIQLGNNMSFPNEGDSVFLFGKNCHDYVAGYYSRGDFFDYTGGRVENVTKWLKVTI